MRIVRPRPSGHRPGVTVVIPCYNYGHFLPGVVDSVLGQQDVDARIIIVDDASPDGSTEVAQRLAAEEPRVTAVLHAANRGHIATYNDGLALVETEYVTLVSADDVLAPGSLGRATRLMSAFPRVGMVYGHAVSFAAGTEPSPPHSRLPETWTVWADGEWLRWSARRGRNFIMSPEVVMRTAALNETGGYRPELPHSGDLELWLRTAARWDVGRVNGTPQAYYRVHGGNMHLTSYATMAVDLQHRLAAFESLVDADMLELVPDAPRLLSSARRALAKEALVLAARDLDRGRSPEAATTLLHFSLSLRDGSGPPGARLLAARVRRAQRGTTPSTIRRGVEFGRRHLDRVRALIWELAGVS